MALAAAFFTWHAKLQADVENMTSVFGFDELKKSLSESFGSRPVKRAMDAMIESVSAARERELGVPVRMARLPMSRVLRTQATEETDGFMKAMVSAVDDQIVGFTMLGPEAGQVVAAVQTAMLAKLR